MNTSSLVSRSLLVLCLATLGLFPPKLSYSQTTPAESDRAVTLLADVQEANAQTGILTATGNVQIFYPRKGITATAMQAQYFSRERRMILTGNVLVTQTGGNSIRGERVTYLLDEERFIVSPKANEQVQSIYVIPENETESTAPTGLPDLPETPTLPADTLIDNLPQ
ncbi:MAG: LptA/OstA family protein [Prochlorotrichaceae cyanobacterium]